MNKLSRKFIIGITVVLCFFCLCTILFNSVFLDKYYLYQKRKELSAVCGELDEKILNGTEAEKAISQTEETNKVIVVKIEEFRKKNNDIINEYIRSEFQENGIGFQKYWLWDKDYERILKGESCRRLYSQEKLNYSLLVEYRQIDSVLYTVTMIIPDIRDAFEIINMFLVGADIVFIVIAIVVIIFLINRIVKPLSDFQVFASLMEENQFVPLQVQTKDELESVAESLNSMGERIIEYQVSLKEKNQQMEQLLDNVAHDLKTPISLIQLYGSGLKDGLDDGTFLDTILEENSKMAEMVNRLLYLSRIEKKDYEKTEIKLDEMLEKLMKKYSVLAEKNQRDIHLALEKECWISGSEDMVTSLFTNLLTNAIKYSSGRKILMELFEKQNQIIFKITNETDNQSLDISKIWEPYYVGEKSRNKNLSGTGLGLSIVKKICETQFYEVECTREGKNIIFTVIIPCKPVA